MIGTFFVDVLIVGDGLGRLLIDDGGVFGLGGGDLGLVDPQLRLLHQQPQSVQIAFDLFVRLHVAVGHQQLHLIDNQKRQQIALDQSCSDLLLV